MARSAARDDRFLNQSRRNGGDGLAGARRDASGREERTRREVVNRPPRDRTLETPFLRSERLERRRDRLDDLSLEVVDPDVHLARDPDELARNGYHRLNLGTLRLDPRRLDPEREA